MALIQRPCRNAGVSTMLESHKQRPGKRKRMGPPMAATLVQGGESDQAIQALEAYAIQAEEALGVALDEVALKDRRIATLEAELRSQVRGSSTTPSTESAAVVLPNLSAPLSRPAQQTQQALIAINQQSHAAERALSELLSAAHEQDQGYQQLKNQLQEARSALTEQQNVVAEKVQEASRAQDKQIAELAIQNRRLEESLKESRLQLAASHANVEKLEKEVEDLRNSTEAQDHQVQQLREVLEHYVLRCRELEQRTAREGHSPSDTPNNTLSAVAQRLKA